MGTCVGLALQARRSVALAVLSCNPNDRTAQLSIHNAHSRTWAQRTTANGYSAVSHNRVTCVESAHRFCSGPQLVRGVNRISERHIVCEILAHPVYCRWQRGRVAPSLIF